jgi:hypothetical protein
VQEPEQKFGRRYLKSFACGTAHNDVALAIIEEESQ